MGVSSWVTLATNDSYSLGALVLAHSLKESGTIHQLAVLVTPGVTIAMRDKLSSVFNVVHEVNILDSKDDANLRLLKRPELGITFTKIHCWRLVQFEKCVFLDADTLVLKNSDELFEREEFSAAPDVGWPDCFNSGVFVYRPSLETYEKLIQFALEKGSFDGGDQGLLNLYFSDWAHKDISKHLPFIYNLCSTACYSYLPAFKQFGGNAKIIHFIGPQKPWLQYFNTETKRVHPSHDSTHLQEVLQLWWNLFCSLIHPQLSPEMAGLAGAFAQLTLGVARTAEQNALENLLRKQAWEVGSIDYLGKDSFSNILSKITETLQAAPEAATAAVAASVIVAPEPHQTSAETPISQTVSQTEVAVESALPNIPSETETPKESKIVTEKSAEPEVTVKSTEEEIVLATLPSTEQPKVEEKPTETCPLPAKKAEPAVVVEVQKSIEEVPQAAPAETALTEPAIAEKGQELSKETAKSEDTAIEKALLVETCQLASKVEEKPAEVCPLSSKVEEKPVEVCPLSLKIAEKPVEICPLSPKVEDEPAEVCPLLSPKIEEKPVEVCPLSSKVEGKPSADVCPLPMAKVEEKLIEEKIPTEAVSPVSSKIAVELSAEVCSFPSKVEEKSSKVVETSILDSKTTQEPSKEIEDVKAVDLVPSPPQTPKTPEATPIKIAEVQKSTTTSPTTQIVEATPPTTPGTPGTPPVLPPLSVVAKTKETLEAEISVPATPPPTQSASTPTPTPPPRKTDKPKKGASKSKK